MKENKRKIVSLAVFAVLAAGLYFARRSVKSPIVALFAMVFFVLFCERAISVALDLFKPKTHRGQTVLTIVSSLGRYVSAIVILCWGLSILGVNVSGILASVGILTLVVGFSAESLIADVITGVFILFENQYNVGDIVEVGGFRGTVNEIGIRTTSIMDVGGNVKIVNNSDMKNILNRSDRASVAAASIDIPYDADLRKLESEIPALMEEIYHNHEDVMFKAPEYLGVQELGASGVTLRFIAEVEEQNIFKAVRILNHDLLLGFKDRGVECPYPQLDIHNK